MMNNRVELIEEDIELVNGGFDFNDMLRKGAEFVVDAGEKLVDHAVKKTERIKKKLFDHVYDANNNFYAPVINLPLLPSDLI